MMLLDLFILVLSAAVVVGTVRYLLIPGIGIFCAVMKLSEKVRGQIIGYATSVPEFVVVICGAFAGVFNAGMWNIASSNIINWVLFLAAVLVYRKQLHLVNKVFWDEIAFGIISVIIPLVLFALHVETSVGVAFGLLGFFAFYRIMDRVLNIEHAAEAVEELPEGDLGKGIMLMVVGLAIIVGAGFFLGDSAEALIQQIGVPSWAVGWLLGFITSIPEMTSFFEIYRLHKPKDHPEYLADTREALEALVSSNVSNLGIILPVGMLIYLLIGSR